MGALHDGHLSLIQKSKSENERTVVSIFVNPTQFRPGEDLEKYPRPFERDCEMAASAGADLIFAPSTEEIYGEFPTKIHVPFVTEMFEGTTRPGHFEGVATIVAKLFNIVSPKNAYFGEKDLQQCSVIKKLVKDLNFSINIIICDTFREESGLAKSSRNAYLSEDELRVAPLLYKVLIEAKTALINGTSCQITIENSKSFLTNNTFSVDYFELVDRETMQPLIAINDHASLIVAASLGATRLIDNVRVVG